MPVALVAGSAAGHRSTRRWVGGYSGVRRPGRLQRQTRSASPPMERAARAAIHDAVARPTRRGVATACGRGPHASPPAVRVRRSGIIALDLRHHKGRKPLHADDCWQGPLLPSPGVDRRRRSSYGTSPEEYARCAPSPGRLESYAQTRVAALLPLLLLLPEGSSRSIVIEYLHVYNLFVQTSRQQRIRCPCQ